MGPTTHSGAAPFGVVEIRGAKDHAADVLRITPPMRTMLEFVAAHGGEVPFSWDDYTPIHAQNPAHAAALAGVRELLVDMINARLFFEREYLRSSLQVQGRLVLRLTDKGKSVVEALQKPLFVPGTVKSISKSEIAQEMSP